jgi:hypothetical protein
MRIRLGLSLFGFLLIVIALGRPSNTVRAAHAVNPADFVGVAATGDPNALPRIGVKWFLTYGWGGTIPAGMRRAIVVRLTPAPDTASLLATVKANPGSALLIGNEPNVPTVSSSDNLTPAQYATMLHDLVTQIKQVDRTALIVGPNVLNWDVACISGCGGFPTGQDWTKQFVTAYVNAYQQRPPIDRWAIHTYQLDWSHTPMLDTNFVFNQLTNFRSYVNSLGSAKTPIWDSELGIMWAYPGWHFDTNNQLQPDGAYDTAGVNAWLQRFVQWQTQTSVNVERSFLFAQSPVPIEGEGVYGGLRFFVDGSAGAATTPAGQTLGILLSGGSIPVTAATTTGAQPAAPLSPSSGGPAPLDPRLWPILP